MPERGLEAGMSSLAGIGESRVVIVLGSVARTRQPVSGLREPGVIADSMSRTPAHLTGRVARIQSPANR